MVEDSHIKIQRNSNGDFVLFRRNFMYPEMIKEKLVVGNVSDMRDLAEAMIQIANIVSAFDHG